MAQVPSGPRHGFSSHDAAHPEERRLTQNRDFSAPDRRFDRSGRDPEPDRRSKRYDDVDAKRDESNLSHPSVRENGYKPMEVDSPRVASLTDNAYAPEAVQRTGSGMYGDRLEPSYKGKDSTPTAPRAMTSRSGQLSSRAEHATGSPQVPHPPKISGNTRHPGRGFPAQDNGWPARIASGAHKTASSDDAPPTRIDIQAGPSLYDRSSSLSGRENERQSGYGHPPESPVEAVRLLSFLICF